ncbi:hypothetical protein [Klebsiella michiganensis]|uniref:hypothetical protein n=1 Tax=Klebsiella michiganensis TaxID=1134687 RepID=UPI001CCFF7D8|nr:hypothetical protein [Klebsiella michiganensis]
MTTDITELAQLRAELSNPAIGSKDHLRKLALSLVEALEKAQQVDEELCKLLPPGAEYMDPPDGGDVTPLEGVRRMVTDYRQRIAELESRTVKMPPKIERDDADGWFMYNGGRVGGGAAEWYNKALDDVGAEITAAGIKWEAE